MTYNHYGPGFGHFMDSELLRRYQAEVNPHFTIFDDGMSEKERSDVEDILKTSLENGKTFYANAPEYIRASMREYEQMLRDGVLF